MHTTNVHMAYSPPRTSSWAKKSGCDVSLVGPAVLSSLRPWGTILRPFLSDGVLAGPGTALRVRHAAGRSRRCPICQTMSACCSSLCSGRAKAAGVRTGTASLISGPAVHRTGTRLWTCRAVQLTDGRSRSRRARRGAGTARAGSTATTKVLPSSRLQNPESGAGPGLANASSSAAAGSLPSPGGGPDTDVMDPAAIGPPATRGVRHRRRTAGRRTVAGPGYRRHLAWMAALTVLLLLTAAGTTVALLRQHGGGNPAAGGGGGGTALAGAAASRAAAARWVSREVSRSDIIGCDSVMCGALVESGVPSADLLAIYSHHSGPARG